MPSKPIWLGRIMYTSFSRKLSMASPSSFVMTPCQKSSMNKEIKTDRGHTFGQVSSCVTPRLSRCHFGFQARWNERAELPPSPMLACTAKALTSVVEAYQAVCLRQRWWSEWLTCSKTKGFIDTQIGDFHTKYHIIYIRYGNDTIAIIVIWQSVWGSKCNRYRYCLTWALGGISSA